MNELQGKLLELYKEFARVCDENGLTYFACAGTCLGAVRHNGFIPWDDDIDVMMPREDYEKFLKLENPFSDEKYFLQTFRTDRAYIYNYAKLRDSSTTYIENYYSQHVINHGVWIDIFPIDGRGKKEKCPRKKAAFQNRRAWLNVYLCYPYALKRKFRKKHFFKDLFFNIFAILFFPWNWFHYRNKLVDWWMKRIKYEEATYVGIYSDAYVKKAIWPKEWLDEVVKIKFEDTEMAVPKKYHEYLTMLYGDYMQLPPEDKREGHHYNKGFSLTVGYKDYKKPKKEKKEEN